MNETNTEIIGPSPVVGDGEHVAINALLFIAQHTDEPATRSYAIAVVDLVRSWRAEE